MRTITLFWSWAIGFMVRELLSRILTAEGGMPLGHHGGEPAIERLAAGGMCDLVLL